MIEFAGYSLSEGQLLLAGAVLIGLILLLLLLARAPRPGRRG